MGDWGLEFAARFEGLTDQQTASVEQAIPDFQKLAALYQQAQPIIARVLPVVQMVLTAVEAKEKEFKS